MFTFVAMINFGARFLFIYNSNNKCSSLPMMYKPIIISQFHIFIHNLVLCTNQNVSILKKKDALDYLFHSHIS